MSLRWRCRRWFWDHLAVFKYHHNDPAVIPLPVDDRPLATVRLVDGFPGIAVRGVMVADRVPKDESHLAKRLFGRLQAALYRVVSPMQAGLPPIAPEPDVALDDAYTARHRRCYPPPRRPPEFMDAVDLGALAVASPYWCYLHRGEPGRYRWDLSDLDGFELHAGVRSPAAVVEFAVAPDRRALEPVLIDSDLGVARPSDPEWAEAVRAALCGVTTHLSLVRHFNWLHLSIGSPLAVATRNCLPAVHPLRRFLWPHVFGTQYSNAIVTIDQMSVGGDFEGIFSYTHSGMCELFESTHPRADFVMTDPEVDAERRGVLGGGFATPAHDNRMALLGLLRDHARRYLACYYRDDEALTVDDAVQSWVAGLDRTVPNGVRHLVPDGLTLDSAARLLGGVVYLTTVEHEIVGSGVWDYQLWTDAQPVRLRIGGGREPLDVYQRLVNANFNLNVHRTPLLTDFSYLAVDASGAEAFRRFRADLVHLQADLDRTPSPSWRMEPKFLKANINA